MAWHILWAGHCKSIGSWVQEPGQVLDSFPLAVVV